MKDKTTITIEQLAGMTQQEFLEINKTMATKQDLREVGSEILSANAIGAEKTSAPPTI